MNLPRHLEDLVKKSLKIHPVVLICGPRQAGKTTLCRELIQEDGFKFVSFDDLRFLSAASSDPMGFLEGLPKPLILDEVQRIPDIFLTIKQDVDRHRVPGRYLLTGSANPLLLPKVADSLAGRMEVLRLYPFSQGELRRTEETFLQSIFEEDFSPLPEEGDLISLLLKGGYPPVQGFEDAESMESWFHGYCEAMMQKDMRDLARIEGISVLPRLLQLLAARSGTLLNIAELGRSVKLSQTTLHRYLTLLRALFLLDFLPPWSKNIGKRLVKSPKLYFLDTGLLAFLQGQNESQLRENPSVMGHLLENFVVTELYKQASWTRPRVELYHFRSQSNQEVDLVLEKRGGDLVGIEIKSTVTVKSNDFKGLRYLQKITEDRFRQGIVLYRGNEIISFGKNLVALPISSIWA